jgi:hypothetical protein
MVVSHSGNQWHVVVGGRHTLRLVTEHLLLFPERDTADEIATELAEEGFTEVRVIRVAHAGEDDAEDAEWGVHIREEMVDDQSGPVEGGLRDRFRALAAEHDGWYDPEPTLP